MPYQTFMASVRVGNHRIIVSIGVFRDAQIFLDLPAWIGEKWPLRPKSIPELIGLQQIVPRDRYETCITESFLRVPV